MIDDNHNHDGINSQQINPKDFLGFPVYTFSSSSAVTAFLNSFQTPEGTILFTIDSSGPTYKQQTRMNKAWRSVTLT
jgi:hypothetical protein